MSDESNTAMVFAGTRLHIQPPNKLAIGENGPKNWKLFKQRMESYAIMTEVDKQQSTKCLND